MDMLATPKKIGHVDSYYDDQEFIICPYIIMSIGLLVLYKPPYLGKMA